MTGLMLCDDLIFSSKVTATARAHGGTVAVAKDPATALRLATSTPPSGVIIDLHNPGLDLPVFLAELHAIQPVRVVGFGSHVDVGTLKAAREAGCDLVLPRSAFVQRLESELPQWLAGMPTADSTIS